MLLESLNIPLIKPFGEIPDQIQCLTQSTFCRRCMFVCSILVVVVRWPLVKDGVHQIWPVGFKTEVWVQS